MANWAINVQGQPRAIVTEVPDNYDCIIVAQFWNTNLAFGLGHDNFMPKKVDQFSSKLPQFQFKSFSGLKDWLAGLRNTE